MMTTIDGIKIFEFDEDYSDLNSIGDIIEIEKGAFGIIEEKIEESEEIKLRIISNINDISESQIIDDLLDEINANPENKKSAEALIKFFNSKSKK